MRFKPLSYNRFLVKQFKKIAIAFFALLTFISLPILANEPNEAAQLSIEGKKLYEAGQFEAAASVWQQAADIYAEAGNTEGVTQSLTNLAEALQAEGRYLKACNTLLQANGIAQADCQRFDRQQQTAWLKILAQRPKSLIQATSLRSLGDVLQKLDRLELSERVLQLSLKIARESNFREAAIANLLSLGNLKRAEGDRERLLPESIINAEETQKIAPKATALSCPQPSSLKKVVSFYQQADSFYQQAASEANSGMMWVQAQLNRLVVLQQTNATSDAIALFPQIQSQLQTLPTTQIGIYARINLAGNLICLKSTVAEDTLAWKDIARVLATAIEDAKSIRDRRAESHALGYLGWLYQQTQQLSEAKELTQQALLQAQAIQSLDIAYKWQWQLGYLLNLQGDVKGAIASYNEAINSLQSLRRDLTAVSSQIQFSFRDEVEPVYRQLVDLLLQAETPSQENLQRSRQLIELLQLAELENFLQEACLEPRVEIDRVVERNDSTATVIYPIILEKRLEIIVKVPGQKQLRHYHTTISQEEIESTILKLRQSLTDVTQTLQVQKLSQQLYDWLIRTPETEWNDNNIETLVFVLDGSLRNLPMAVLYDAKEQKYLVEKYAIALAPSLQLVNPKPLQQSPLNVLLAGVSKQRSIQGRTFSSLIGVREELKAIQSVISSSQQLLDRQFTLANLQNTLRLNSLSVVHLATHGKFSSNPEKTFILAWDRLIGIEELVNLLQIDSASRTDAIELLVLSACETARGDNRATLGLAGIAVRAGTRSTLATLWSVDDRSTTAIMSQFYRAIETGMPKAKALQMSQRAFLSQEKRPYFWAPFILVGNWL
jgi:CHAT domain-containing protein